MITKPIYILDVPAVVPVLAHLRIVEAIDLLQRDLSVLDVPDDVTAARGPDVDGEIILHAHSISNFRMVVPSGVEPLLWVSKTRVLPLYEGTG